MRPSQTFQVLEELRNSFSAPLYRKGVGLSPDDSCTVLDVYQQWILLMVDCGYLHPETLKRDAQRLWIDLIHNDVYDLNNSFAECLQSIRLQTIKGFKALCKRISSHLFNLIRQDLERIPLSDVYAAKRLVQIFSYTSRLSLHDIDLTQQCLDDYMASEDNMPLEYPVVITDALNTIMRRWLGPYQPGEIYPHHGPGGVAGHGRCALETKYKDLSSDALMTYAFGNPWWIDGPVRSSLDRISSTIFVPKSYKTFRTISMEPSTLMYFQQGVWDLIDRQVKGHPVLRKHIAFQDQSRNRELSRQGSIDRQYATIDLSAASDSVSYSLVKKVFRGTWLLRYLVALRSKRTLLPDGRLIVLKKFAPMGSALCFPVETLIFAAICEHVTRVLGVAGKYSVYGDDIIVPTIAVDNTMRILERLGFRVNRDKSFYQQDCWFRESCGGEFCDGFDVTPMRVSRKYASKEQDVRFDKLVALANIAYERGYRNLRYFFIAKLRSLGIVPYFSPTSLLSDNYTNYHTKVRWNRRLQYLECLVTTKVTKHNKKTASKQDEAIRYRHWLESTVRRISADEGFESMIPVFNPTF